MRHDKTAKSDSYYEAKSIKVAKGLQKTDKQTDWFHTKGGGHKHRQTDSHYNIEYLKPQITYIHAPMSKTLLTKLSEEKKKKNFTIWKNASYNGEIKFSCAQLIVGSACLIFRGDWGLQKYLSCPPPPPSYVLIRPCGLLNHLSSLVIEKTIFHKIIRKETEIDWIIGWI